MQKFLLQPPLRLLLAAVFMIGIFTITSCKDDDGDKTLPPVTVQFPANGSVTVAENAAASQITLALSGAAPQDGTITITGTNATGVLGFDTEISVTKGNTVAILNIDPTDNATIDGPKVVTLTIANTTAGFTIGEKKTYTVNVVDDEGPTTANFVTTEASINELDGGGIDINIDLTPAAKVAGTVTITIDPADAAITTTPAATDGVITLPVSPNDADVSFKVIPVNNESDDGGFTVTFTLAGDESGVQAGASTEFMLSVVDDDAIVPETIASIRETYQGSDVIIEEDIYIKGVVTSVSGTTSNIHERGMYIQDASGAIYLYFAAAHEKTRGKEVLINLKGSTLKLNNNLLQLESTPVSNITEIGDGTLPTPRIITVKQLADGEFESELVKLEGVTFVDADGILTMNGLRGITDGTDNSAVYTRIQSSFKDQILPVGSGDLVGIASTFTTGPQLLIQVVGDIFENNPIGTITTDVTEGGLDFGVIDNGDASASQSYTVIGTTLGEEIIVTGTGSFKVSTNDIDFVESLNLPSTGGTIYVKFTPATGVDGDIAAKISHKSKGAVTLLVDVTGEETGNAPTVLLLNENFNYSIGTLTSVAGSDNVSGGKWGNVNGTTNLLKTVAGNLEYTNYSVGEGAKVAMINGSAEDGFTAFTENVTSGKVYLAFLVNVTSATGLAVNTSTTGDHFAGFLPSNSLTALDARVSIRAGVAANTFNLGFRATSSNSAADFGATPTDYALNQTHLIVISYEIVPPGDPVNNANDIMQMWIDPDFSGSEPTATFSQVGAAADLLDVGRFYLRQGTSAVNADIDAIRAAKSWADLFGN